MALDRDAIAALLADLDAELARQGSRADLFLVGGAVIAVAYDARRSTRTAARRARVKWVKSYRRR